MTDRENSAAYAALPRSAPAKDHDPEVLGRSIAHGVCCRRDVRASQNFVIGVASVQFR
jgi:hypothetical protein